MMTVIRRKFLRAAARDERGAALLEFALVSLVFFATTFGIMEYGRMLLAYNVVSNAAREGVRWASVRGTSSGHAASASDIQSYVANRSSGQLSTSNISVSWSPDNKPGSTVQVQAQFVFSPIVPLIPQQTRTLVSTSTMLINR